MFAIRVFKSGLYGDSVETFDWLFLEWLPYGHKSPGVGLATALGCHGSVTPHVLGPGGTWIQNGQNNGPYTA